MANPYMGLAGSLARARRPTPQNDVYMQQPRGTGRPPTAFAGRAGKPGGGGMPYGNSAAQGFGGAGFGSGIAGVNAFAPPQSQQPVSMSPPMGGGLFGGGAGTQYSGVDPSPTGGTTPGIFQLGPPTPMTVPGFGGGPSPGGSGGPVFGGPPAPVGNTDPNTRRLMQPTGGIRPPSPPYP